MHPTSPQTILTGGTDGLVNIFNTTHPAEEDALVQVSNHGSSIAHAAFLSTTQFYALSHDENFSIYQLNKSDGSPVEDLSENALGDLRGPLECEYVVDCIPSFGNGQAVLAAGTHSKQQLNLIPLVSVDFVGSEIWDFNIHSTINLTGAHGEEIVRSLILNNQVCIRNILFTLSPASLSPINITSPRFYSLNFPLHRPSPYTMSPISSLPHHSFYPLTPWPPQTNTIHTAGEDGAIKAWRLSDQEDQDQAEMSIESPTSTKHQQHDTKKKKSNREKKGRETNDAGAGDGGESGSGKGRYRPY